MEATTSNWCYDADDKSQQQFHALLHSDNIRLSEGFRTAKRLGSFRGLCFSSKPLKPLFPFVVKIIDEEPGWTGHLRIGLTWASMSPLPNLNSNDFIRQTVLAPLPRALQSTSASSTDINSAVCIYFKSISPGFIQPFVIINGEHICLQAPLLAVPEDRDIFAVVDLFGVCKAVQVLPVKHSVLRLSTICEKRIRKALNNAQLAEALPLPKPMRQSIMRLAIGPVVVV